MEKKIVQNSSDALVELIRLAIISEIEPLMRKIVSEELAYQEYKRIQEEERIAISNTQLLAEQEERFLKKYPFLRESE